MIFKFCDMKTKSKQVITCIYNRLLLNNLQVISRKYGRYL